MWRLVLLEYQYLLLRIDIVELVCFLLSLLSHSLNLLFSHLLHISSMNFKSSRISYLKSSVHFFFKELVFWPKKTFLELSTSEIWKPQTTFLWLSLTITFRCSRIWLWVFRIFMVTIFAAFSSNFTVLDPSWATVILWAPFVLFYGAIRVIVSLLHVFVIHKRR